MQFLPGGWFPDLYRTYGTGRCVRVILEVLLVLFSLVVVNLPSHGSKNFKVVVCCAAVPTIHHHLLAVLSSSRIHKFPNLLSPVSRDAVIYKIYLQSSSLHQLSK